MQKRQRRRNCPTTPFAIPIFFASCKGNVLYGAKRIF